MSSKLEQKDGSECQPSVAFENFHASDADVIFRSSDNVLFHIHRKNLEIQAGAFPPSEFKMNGEIVPLTEDSLTLKGLFQYVYPQKHPDIEKLKFDDLYKLAEAAEKYEVFSVMAICKSRLRQFANQCPAEILNYAFLHGYHDILEAAASSLLDLPLDKAVKQVLPNLAIPWVLYRVSWSRTVYNELKKHGKSLWRPKGGFHANCPSPSPEQLELLWASLGDQRSRTALLSLCGLIKSESVSAHITTDFSSFHVSCLDEILAKIPKFDTFLTTPSSY